MTIPPDFPPRVGLGSATGHAGETVSINVAIGKNGLRIVGVSPLFFSFDPTVFDFAGCTTTLTGKQIMSDVTTPGTVRSSLLGDNSILPEGTVMQCSFTIRADAPAGDYPLVFQVGGMIDDQGTVFAAQGTDGAVIVVGADTL
jgi:hypothetical protein